MCPLAMITDGLRSLIPVVAASYMTAADAFSVVFLFLAEKEPSCRRTQFSACMQPAGPGS